MQRVLVETEPKTARQAKLLEAGLILIVIWTPLAFLPTSTYVFVDVKFLTLLVGTFLVWLGRPTPDRRLGIAASIWIGVAVIASLVGADVWQSVAGQEWIGGGLILLVPCAYLLCVGGDVPTEVRDRIPGWLAKTALVAAAMYLLARYIPSVPRVIYPGADPAFSSSPLGHPVKLAAFMGIGIVASTAWRPKVPAIRYGAVAVLASVLSLSTKRGGWIVAAIGLALVAVRDRDTRRVTTRIMGLVVAILLVLGVAYRLLAPSPTSSGTVFSGTASTESNQARVAAFPSLVAAWRARPIFGWGPGNTWGAYVSNMPLDPSQQGERGLLDAHDIVLESLITTGLVGFLALAALGIMTALSWRGSPRSLSWSIAIALGLLAYQMVEPLSPSLTPLVFLFAGIGTSRSSATIQETNPADTLRRSPGRTLTGICLGAFALLSLSVTISGLAGGIGTRYGSYPALSVARNFAPWRVQPLAQQATFYAVDSRSSGADPQAAVRANQIVRELVNDHPWDPSVRFFAAGIAKLTNDPQATRYWLEEQIKYFPSDGAHLTQSVRDTYSIESLP